MGKKTKAGSWFYPGHKVRLLSGGKAYFTLLLQLIANARDTIHLQVYIYEPDETGQQVADALIAAAKRGVAVYVLVDGYGSQGFPHSFVARFKEHGVRFRVFEPLFRSKRFYIGRRMHQKVLVIDSRYAMVTGANIENKYNDLPGQPAWLDFALCIEGDVAAQLCRLCWSTWNGFQRARKIPVPCRQTETAIDFGQAYDCAVRMRRNDWVRRKHEITRSYREILRGARSQVIMLSSYFLPSTSLRKAIGGAVKRGVVVKLIVCNHMDVPLVKSAERYMYGWLLHHGVEIYEYTPNMLHGKLATCDEEWMTLGSFNVNDLSDRVSVELNIDVEGRGLVKQAIVELETIIANHCLRVDEARYQASSNLLRKALRWLSYRILRFVFFLGTFYMKQERRSGD